MRAWGGLGDVAGKYCGNAQSGYLVAYAKKTLTSSVAFYLDFSFPVQFLFFEISIGTGISS